MSPFNHLPCPVRKSFAQFREPFNGVSHLAGALLSVAALGVLLVVAHGRLRPSVGCGIYGVSLVVLYAASTLYHSLRVSRRTSDWLGRADYIAIFLLIAGTFAPLCLVTLHGPVGRHLLGAEYGLALLGSAGIVLWHRMPDGLRIALYLLMGCLVVPVLPLLQPLLSSAALAWLVAGVLVYLAGAVIFAFDRPTLWPGKNCAHGLWHLFVLVGSACHFVFVLCFVAPAA